MLPKSHHEYNNKIEKLAVKLIETERKELKGKKALFLFQSLANYQNKSDCTDFNRNFCEFGTTL